MPPSQRLVRRAPLVSRIKAYLDPVDFLIWLSEELNSNSLEDTFKQWAAPIGLALNVIFMIARANVQETEPGYDVFADAYERQGSGWLAWFVSRARSLTDSYPIQLTIEVVIHRTPAQHRLIEQRFLHFLADPALSTF